MTARIVFALLGAGTVWCQAARPEFEVASIRPYDSSASTDVNVGMRIDGAQVRLSGLTLKDLLAMAYRAKAYQISGPDWLATERFAVAATLPSGSTAAQVPEMLQNLLEDRFQAKIHREKKDFAIYALETDKGGLKVQPVPADPNEAPREAGLNASGSANGVSVNLGNGASYMFANNKFEAKKISFELLARSLERYVDRPIVDETGVAGNFDLVLTLTDEDYRGMLIRAAVNSGVVLPPQALRALEAGSLASVTNSLEKIGVRLASKKAPLDVIVVASARKTPTEN